MFGKKALLFVSLASGAVLGMPAFGLADTITLHDLSENAATGVFTYTVTFDDAADVLTGDGFVVYDFNDLTSWSLTGDVSTSQFSLFQSVTSNNLTTPSSVDLFGSTAASSNGLAFDNPLVENLSFDYVGPPSPFTTPGIATLTLTTGKLNGTPVASVYASVDHSGADTTTSYQANAVLVPSEGTPNSGPLPLSSVGGGILFALVGLGRFLRSRRVDA